ncbi:hypothetical protein BDZ91DRAFT_123295 [Kalaharituber pfeilii]|nr:hypothetical protein BDZ91DRAFT_123295 [Kalaharituber pfeilii]
MYFSSCRRQVLRVLLSVLYFLLLIKPLNCEQCLSTYQSQLARGLAYLPSPPRSPKTTAHILAIFLSISRICSILSSPGFDFQSAAICVCCLSALVLGFQNPLHPLLLCGCYHHGCQ